LISLQTKKSDFFSYFTARSLSAQTPMRPRRTTEDENAPSDLDCGVEPPQSKAPSAQLFSFQQAAKPQIAPL